MIFWEADALNDRENLYKFLYDFNPLVAEKADELLVSRIELLFEYPELGVNRLGLPGRLLIIPDISLVVSYIIRDDHLFILRVLHQKQNRPNL
ncbi:MAG: plasmid stabilization protein ParE [Idiomarina sp. 34-48-12]|nr:MAG: plasmid stabilization protein ParE [Idiomarina sp. 34-48-12]